MMQEVAGTSITGSCCPVFENRDLLRSRSLRPSSIMGVRGCSNDSIQKVGSPSCIPANAISETRRCVFD